MIISPHEFFTTLFPNPLSDGQLMLWSTIRRSGKNHTDWCFSLLQAGRLASHYRRTRQVWFGVALQDRRQALSQARRRYKRATPARVRGGEGSATVLPALWAQIDLPREMSAGPRSADPQSADRAAALARFEAVPRPPSIVVSTVAGFDAYWLLEEPWVLADADDRRQAKELLAKVRWALDGAAPGAGPGVAQEPDLAGLARVPGTLWRAPRGPAVPISVEQFPLPGDVDRWRYPRAAFAALEMPPERPGEDPWAAPGGVAPSAAGEAVAADFRPVWRGCSWLRHCHRRQATLPEAEWRAALSIVGRCHDGSESDGRSLARSFSDRHPGYAPHVLDQELTRILGRDTGLPGSGPPGSGLPARCEEIAAELGAWQDHCRRCPHRRRIDSPIDLGRPDPTPAPAPPVAEEPSPEIAEPGGPAAGGEAGAGAGVQVEVVLRATLPAPGSAAVPPDDATGELVRSALACLGLPPSAVAAGGAGGGEHLRSFFIGLDELLVALGGEATARAMAEALAAGENRGRFVILRAALGRLIPELDGAVPSAQQLGYLLRSHHQRTVAGRTIVHGGERSRGVTWSIRDGAPAPGEGVSS